MRVLVSSTGGVGHLLPLLPVAWALDRAGHAVRIACPESFTGFAGRYGLPVSGFGEPDPDEFAAVWATVPFDDTEEANRVVVGQVYGRLDATAALPGLDALVGQWRPDLLVRDTNEYGAALVAERYRLPCVRVGCSLAVTDTAAAPAAADGLAALGPLPPRVHAERFVPQDQVLGAATVMVTHGGSGSVLGALAAGLPLVVLPLFADQPHNAARVTAVGAGMTIAGGPAAAGQIGAVVAAVLDNPAYRAGATCRRRDRGATDRRPDGGQAHRAGHPRARLTGSTARSGAHGS